MKLVILAGGLGTRISEETLLKPKPMIEIGGKPLHWHIMKMYSQHKINDFVVCCGYKGYLIKEYFSNYFLHMSNVTFDMKNNKVTFHQQNVEPWTVTLVDTGDNSQTGGRLKRIQNYVKDEEAFCFTYGDGVSDINISDLITFHFANKKLATVTAIQPPGRYGALDIRDGSIVKGFSEKPKGDGGWINGGFFVLSPKCLNFIDSDSIAWEIEPLSRIAKEGELIAYKHLGFWQSMDTLRDKNYLEDLWATNKAPWKSWNE